LRKQDAQLRPPVSAGRRLISSVLAANSIRIENSANRVKSAVPQVVHPEQRIHSLTFCPDSRDACRGNCFTLCVKSRGSNISCRGASVE
jgi:hypothetical protein